VGDVGEADAVKTLLHKTHFAFAIVLAVGCVVDDDGTGGDGDDTSATSQSTTVTTSTTGATMTTAGTDSADTGATGGTADDTAGTATMGTGSDSSTTVDPNEFIFLPNPPGDYTQVDRKGMPGVNTALNLNVDTLPADHKDAYNLASPLDDANLTFQDNIVDSLDTLHLGDPTPADQMVGMGLDDDLAMLPLVPCIPPQLPADDCIIQAGPLVIPDVLAINTEAVAGFPNGRLLADPVIDITLAVILLDITGPMSGQLTAFVDAPLSQMGNDGTTTDTFPYLAPAWAP
jgi:hypothetical protein